MVIDEIFPDVQPSEDRRGNVDMDFRAFVRKYNLRPIAHTPAARGNNRGLAGTASFYVHGYINLRVTIEVYNDAAFEFAFSPYISASKLDTVLCLRLLDDIVGHTKERSEDASMIYDVQDAKKYDCRTVPPIVDDVIGHEFYKCAGADCAHFRMIPLQADDRFMAAVNKARSEGIDVKQAARHVIENRTKYGLPEKSTKGYCGLAGKPEI